ncbi:LuxR C-terminal-related transcriptional regulator [Streptomyces sp. TRM70308]|uniref:helix-turn-helix transcriptional regulator n=1 Tax=Streptomyces sp. TRM70308 TaxID=3131932 RepID=UPI003CFF323D
MTAHELTWRSEVRGILTGERAGSVLVWVEGAAGIGKSHLLAEVGTWPGSAGATRVVWSCGAGGAPSEEEWGQGPVLLLVDDVHRADPEERDWLRAVLERPRPGLAAVVAYRPEELSAVGLPLGAPVGYPRELVLFRHRLEAWDMERVRATAVEYVGEECPREVVERLHERSGGVAQVVVDLLSAVRERGGRTCTALDVEAVGVPVRLAELALGRLYGLSPEHRPIVWAAAVLGEPACEEELAAVSGLGPELGGQALLVALADAALADHGQGRYGFTAPLAALAVRSALPGPVRRALHERAAGALARRQPVPWSAVAGHRRAAGCVRGWLRAVEKAAREAAESGRYQGAVDLLEQALASPTVPRQDRAWLAPLLASSAVVGLRSDQTVEVLTQIVRDAALPVAVRGEVRLELGLLLRNQVGDFAAGWRELEAAAAELRQTGLPLAGRAMASLAMPYWPGLPLDVHRRWLHEAIEVTEAGGDEALRAAVLANRAWFGLSCGESDAWELLEKLPTDSLDPACLQHAARGLCNAADAAVWLGFYDRAEELLARGLDLSAQSGAPYTEHTALGTRLLLQWWTGRWTGLAERCEEFVTATADMPMLAADARVVRGLLAFAQGDWGRAWSWLAGPHATAPGNTPAPLAATISGALIRLALARQELPTAAEHARAAWAETAAKGVWAWAAELAPWSVEALARAGDVSAAEAVVLGFAENIAGHDAPAAQAALVWSEAALAEARGHMLRAAERYEETAAAFGALSRPYAQTLTAEGAARCVLAAHGPAPGDGHDGAALPGTAAEQRDEGADAGRAAATRAITALESCAQRFSDLGAVWDAARARALLRVHHPADRGRRGRPASPDQLTPRESEVAELAAGGMTNREIAATLHLSTRTVEQHVTRAMRKTGALSRYDLGYRRS